MISSWSSLQSNAGPPAERLFMAKERLFGQPSPQLRLWHDAAGWCPFCAQVWTVLEEMRVPYVMETVPLPGYMKPGEESVREAYKAMSPDGSVPGIQISTGDTDQTTGKVVFGPVLGSCAKTSPSHLIVRDLSESFPERALFPNTPLRRSYAEALAAHVFQLEKAISAVASQSEDPENVSMYIAVMNDFESALSGSGVSEIWQLSHWGDDGDGDEQYFGGTLAGPFLFGHRPCAVDILMLPWLERADANHGRTSPLSLSRWPAVMEMLATARKPGICAWSEIGSDRESLNGIKQRFAKVVKQAPTVEDISDISARAKSALPAAQRDALARLSANHAAVARFACHGAGAGRPSVNTVDDDLIRLADEALRAVATTMIETLDQVDAVPETTAEAVARCMIGECGSKAAHDAASTLFFLAENVGVPRDMTAEPAMALRAFCRLVGLSLVKQGNVESSL